MIRDFIYQKQGPFSEELELADSSFGFGKLPKRLLPERTVTSVCGYCSVGCSLDVHIKNGEAVNVTPAVDYPVNLGGACPKGWEVLAPLRAVAMTEFVNNFTRIQRTYGKDSLAFLSTGQITTEEMALLGAVAKFGMGIVHGDGNTRQCMATAAVAYKQSFGFDAPPFTCKDFEESDVLVFVGANPCIAHPILWERVVLNPHAPEIIVVDPRKTETAMAATRHYALEPKSDLVLFYGLAHILIEEGWFNRGFIDQHTNGFEDFHAHVQSYTPEVVARVCGLTPQELYEFAATIHSGKRVSFWWTMGVNQSYEIEGVIAGKIKGLWIIATNPLHSWINQNQLREYLGNLEFLVVQDMYHTTETARSAHLVLPAAGWGEKEGTFINSERRVGVVRKIAPSPGEALADFDIFNLVARYWGCERMFARWESPEAVFEIMKEIFKGQPCDISGIRDYQMLEEQGGIQWPFPAGVGTGLKPVPTTEMTERRLFEDGRFFHEDGRARFMFEKEKPVPETVNGQYPFVLLTGRGTSSQWHTQTRTAKSAVLRKMYPQDVYVEINPRDAVTLNIKQGQWVYVSTLRGEARAQAIIIPTVKPGQIFMPMHYVETNQLTLAMFDPYSRQPSYKICAASISADARDDY
jgi:anaerobic selenocysteine-containing dehydrogenase